METVEHLTLPLLLGALGVLAAIVLSRVAQRWSIPTPAIFLAVGVLANELIDPGDPVATPHQVAQVGTIALVLILFEGGFSGGMRRMRGSLVPVLSLGLLGTFATTALLALAGHALLDLSWQTASLVAIALAPTDPAAVFSVLGSRDVRGRSSAIIEGESGANDPVGIALMIAALAYVAGDGSVASATGTFVLQLVVGVAVGLALGHLGARLFAHARRLPVAAIATAFAVYGTAALLHGSGFLAVLVAGLVLGDALRHDEQVESLVGIGAALAEIAMFTLLGLAVDIGELGDALVQGLVMFAVLTFLVRPAVVAALLAPVRLDRAERTFIAWGGLKGAVPVLLATFVLLEHVADAEHAFAVVFVAVAASILVQGSTIPWLIGRLGLVEEPNSVPAPGSSP
jgi:cell volume regulation protein A